MEVIKKFGEGNDYETLKRLEVLRENIVNNSKGEFVLGGGNAINVVWKWTNYFEIRLNKSNIRIEIWIADVKHQWNKLTKVSSMNFVSKQEPTSLIEELKIKAEHYVSAYIKLGDSYGNTLKIADFDKEYVKTNFNKEYYKNFYNILGGQWRIDTDDYTRNGRLLIKEIKQLNLLKDEEEKIIKYIQNETRNVINLSLGTTVNIDIPISDLQKKDTNFNCKLKIDELALPIYNYIIEYKEKIEDIKEKLI